MHIISLRFSPNPSSRKNKQTGALALAFGWRLHSHMACCAATNPATCWITVLSSLTHCNFGVLTHLRGGWRIGQNSWNPHSWRTQCGLGGSSNSNKSYNNNNTCNNQSAVALVVRHLQVSDLGWVARWGAVSTVPMAKTTWVDVDDGVEH